MKMRRLPSLILFAMSMVIGSPAYSQVFDSGKPYYMANYTSGSGFQPATPAGHMALMAGNNQHGIIAAFTDPNGFGITSLGYLNPYTANWVNIPMPPISIAGLAGENQFGAIVHNGTKVAFITNYSSGVWNVIAQSAPWPIAGITGSNNTGPIIFGGSNGDKSHVAYISNYNSPFWAQVPAQAPFQISGISGNNQTGIVAFGGNGTQVAYIGNYSGSWTMLPPVPANILAIAGDNFHGPVVFTNNGVYYLTNFAAPVWIQARATSLFFNSVAGFGGDNLYGVVVGLNAF